MKTGSNYSDSGLLRAERLKTASTTVKRAAGSVRSVIEGEAFHGLTAKEKQTLADAVALLDKISANMARGAKQKKREEDAFELRRKQALAKLAPTFGALKTPREVVPMLDATHSLYLLNDAANEPAMRYMPEAIKEALGDIAYRAAREAGDLDAAIATMWQRFLAGRDKLVVKHQGLIARLEAEQ